MPTDQNTPIVTSTRQTLDLIERRNGKLNAFIAVTPETALAEAALADVRAQAGDTARPLNGMAVGIKDIVDIAGLVTGCGSHTTRQAMPAERDAPVVARLRDAGAIVVGKTHTVEYASGPFGTNEPVGTPINPWDLKVHRIPGGSSSGSGVAAGAGLVPVALGTDTGGSVRIPAALCGCVGLKTTVGRIGRSRVAPLSQTLDCIGPLAADVRTAARFLAAAQGPDPDDPATANIEPADPLADLDRGISGFRIGRIADDALILSTPETRQDFAAAVARLEDLGARIEPITLPETLESYWRLTGQIIAAEGYANWRHLVDDDSSAMTPTIRGRIRMGQSISNADYRGFLKQRDAAIAAFLARMDRLDALVLPTIPFAAMPVADVDEAKPITSTYTRWVNYLDLTALAVPTALTGGLPLSLQIVVRRLDDALALRIGQAFETARGAFPKPPA
jgi:aspartyl-tRNA(Asn)/glutamyl-tRNA(Gln) amidotransferase subunit A